MEGLILTLSNFNKGKKYPLIIIASSITSVKEQQFAYAKAFTKEGYVRFIFDYRFF